MSQVAPNIIAAPELEYKKYKYSHPTYRYRKVIPMQGSNVSVPPGSQITTTLELPPNVLANFTESYLQFDFEMKATVANTYFKTWLDTYGIINSITCYDEMGTYIARAENVQNYIKAIGKKNLSLQEMMTRDSLLQPIHPSNAASSIITTYGAAAAPAVYTTNPISMRHDSTAASVSYIEPQYIRMSAGIANNGTLKYTVRLMLSDIKAAGVFDTPHDIPLTKKYMMNVTFGPGNKAVCIGTNLNDMNNTIDIANEIQVSNLNLMLAVEENRDVMNNVMAKATSGEGFKIWVPFLSAFKFSRDGTNHAITQSFTVEHGQRLQRIIHSAFSRDESKGTAYDCDNLEGKKIESYRTSINSSPRQDFQVDCKRNFEDYMLNKRFIEGSALINRNVYQYNWFHCDDFTEFPGHTDQPLPVPIENCEAGLPLFGPDVALAGDSIVWTSEMITTGDLAHYVWAVGQKMLSIRGTEVTCK